MAYRNKIFVSFDADNDIHYYRLMKAWKQNDNTPFNFFDAHALQQARDSSQEATIKRSLRERMNNSKIMVVLIGDRTRYLFKFVRWELEEALYLGLPIIGVNLNGARYLDENLCPPIIRDELVVYVSFNMAILQHAFESWPDEFYSLRKAYMGGPHYYASQVYKSLGI